MAQPFEGVENDGRPRSRRYCFGLVELIRRPTPAAGISPQMPSAFDSRDGGGRATPEQCRRQGKKPGSRRLADGTDDVVLDTVASHLGRNVLDRRQFTREIAAGGFQQQ